MPAGIQEELDRKTFKKLCNLIYQKAGIKLGENKESLVSARIGKRMRALGCDSFSLYYDLVNDDQTGAELVELLDAISTNTTHFFREDRHFELLGPIMQNWEAQGQTRFRIWCAASSTGEEPYTIAMTLRESMTNLSDVKMLATDISTKVLKVAKAGVYEERHVEKVPKRLLAKYFRRIDATSGTQSLYEVSNDLKRMIKFGRLNLVERPYPMNGPLDIILCRNVMIYFDNVVRKQLLTECYRLLKPGGYLMVGHAESLSGMLSEFKSVEPSVYVKG